MTIVAELELEHERILYQQSVRLTARLRNGSDRTLPGVNAGDAPYWPRLVVSREGGGSRTHTRRTPEGDAGFLVDLPPGELIERSFVLDDLAAVPGPGRYELRAAFEWNDGSGRAVSNSAALDVLPTTPRASQLVPVTGVWSSAWRLVWVNETRDGAFEICDSELRLARRPTLENVGVRPVDYPVELAPGITSNGTRTGLLGWFDGEALWVDNRAQAVPTEAESLRGPLLVEGENVTALFSATEPQGTRLVAVTIADATPKVTTQVIPDVRLAWLTSVCPGPRKRYSYLLTDSPAECVLMGGQWDGLRPPEMIVLARFTGRYLAADAWIFADGVVRGAVLLRSSSPQRGLILQTWSWDAGDRAALSAAATIRLPEDFAFDRAIVGAGSSGAAVVLRSIDQQPVLYQATTEGLIAMGPAPRDGPAHVLFGAGPNPFVLQAREALGWQWVAL